MAIAPKYVAVKGSRVPDSRCMAYWYGPIRNAHDAKNINEPTDQRIANLRGFKDSTGKRAKHTTKHARAARLHPPKISRRSHRLNANQPSSSSLLVGAGNGAPGASCVGNWTYPPRAKGLRDDKVDKIGVEELVVTGWSLLDHPSELRESRKEVVVMLAAQPHPSTRSLERIS